MVWLRPSGDAKVCYSDDVFTSYELCQTNDKEGSNILLRQVDKFSRMQILDTQVSRCQLGLPESNPHGLLEVLTTLSL